MRRRIAALGAVLGAGLACATPAVGATSAHGAVAASAAGTVVATIAPARAPATPVADAASRVPEAVAGGGVVASGAAGVRLAAMREDVAGRAGAAATAPELGDWLTDTRDAVVRIAPCGQGICGRIVGMQYEGAVPRDARGRDKCGEVFIYDMSPGGNGAWRGRILDPDSGSVYSSTLRMLAPDRLSLRGYLLIPLLGGTRIWTRFHGAIGPACRLGAVPAG